MAGPNYSIMTAFNARDNVTKAFDAMGRSAGRFSNNARSAFNQAGRSASQFDDRTSSAFRNSTKEGYKFLTIVKGILAANAIRGGLGMIGNGARQVTTDFLNFDDTIIGAVARFDDLGPAAAKNMGIVQGMSKQVRDSIVGSRFAAVEAAKATNDLALAGYKSGSAIGMLKHMMAFATAGQEDLAEATKMSSDILGGFGLRSSDVAQQTREHLKLNDMLTKSALLSTGGLRDMYETMQTVAPLSKELHASKEEMFAMATVLSNAGIKGTEAATAMKRASLNIFAGGMREELAANGINISDAKTGQLRKLTVILGEIGDKLAPLREDVKLPILKKLFGIYGLGGSLKLLQGVRDILEFERKIGRESGGVTNDVAKAQNMSTFAKVVMLANAALEKGFQVLEKFNGDSNGGLIALADKIRAFDVNPLVDGLRTVGRVVGTVYGAIRPLLPAIPYLAAAWVGWNTALKVWTGLQVVGTFNMIAASLVAGLGPVGAMTTALGGMTVSTAGLATSLVTLWYALAPIVAGLGTVGAAFLISRAMKQNGWGDSRTADELIAERNAPAPNTKDAEAKRFSTITGRLDIAGAPPGSKLTTKGTGAPGFQMHMLGANP